MDKFQYYFNQSMNINLIYNSTQLENRLGGTSGHGWKKREGTLIRISCGQRQCVSLRGMKRRDLQRNACGRSSGFKRLRGIRSVRVCCRLCKAVYTWLML